MLTLVVLSADIAVWLTHGEPTPEQVLLDAFERTLTAPHHMVLEVEASTLGGPSILLVERHTDGAQGSVEISADGDRLAEFRRDDDAFALRLGLLESGLFGEDVAAIDAVQYEIEAILEAADAPPDLSDATLALFDGDWVGLSGAAHLLSARVTEDSPGTVRFAAALRRAVDDLGGWSHVLRDHLTVTPTAAGFEAELELRSLLREVLRAFNAVEDDLDVEPEHVVAFHAVAGFVPLRIGGVDVRVEDQRVTSVRADLSAATEGLGFVPSMPRATAALALRASFSPDPDVAAFPDTDADLDTEEFLAATDRLNSMAPTMPQGFEEAVGRCLAATTLEEADPTDLIDCDQPHRFEMVGTFLLTGAAFPGVEQLDRRSLQGCANKLEAYTAGSLAQSGLEPVFFSPGPLAWNAGDREVVCVAMLPEAATGSVRSRGVTAVLPDHVAVVDLEVGDCVRGDADIAAAALPLVRCPGRSAYEVVHVHEFEGRFPGDDEVFDLSLSLCDEAMADRFGAEWYEAGYDYDFAGPSRDTWHIYGVRTLVCFAYDVTEAPPIDT